MVYHQKYSRFLSIQRLSEFLEVKQTDGWVYTYGTKQDNTLSMSTLQQVRYYGAGGNDNFSVTSQQSDQTKEIKDFGDNDKIKLDMYYTGTTYNIQTENNVPVLYQKWGSMTSTTPNYKVVRVEGPSADYLTIKDALDKFKLGQQQSIFIN